ncbi:heparan-alpha-glucosaminide N-acetyltransferase domain-containing protein [Actinopolymorpha alba]|uniref:heparan-alpha-glucosaminide N-acetyltransferase domain-containing protein n=1 Tax=Actinopolymorpha alba TaxID=533267 RepID=UPI00037ED076|nr:heparan-alpha-glucosaminide N-acetyltransferase domain-containing protein [Actinopolymorpha alba]
MSPTSPHVPATTETPQREQAAPVASKRRIQALDALRGLALCGIIFINIPQTMEMFRYAGEMPLVLRVLALGRFYPIFYLLFGIGFGLFLRSATRSAPRPRVLLLRRFAALAILGGLLQLIQPGEVLLPPWSASASPTHPRTLPPPRPRPAAMA